MAAAYTTNIDEGGVNEVFSDRGPAGQHVAEVKRRAVFLAKRYVGKKTRRLEHMINARTIRTGEAILVEVSADTSYALEHHNGTRPHLITPNNHRMLRFKQGGRVVYAHAVMHPGTRPNPFLLRALREAVGH